MSSLPRDPDTGMQMPGEEIMITVGGSVSLFGIVYKPEQVVQCQDIVGDRDIALLIPLVMQDIMVAADEFDVDIREVMPPFAEEVQFPVLAAVKEISHYYELFGLKILHLLDEPLEILLVNRLRYRYTMLPEMPCFPEMQICQDQRFFFFPENTPLGAKPEVLLL